MSHPSPDTVNAQPAESNLQYAVRMLTAAAPYIVALVGLVVAAWTLAAGPKWAKVFVLASTGSLIVAYPIVSRITAWLWTPETIMLLVVDAANVDGGIEMWELTENEWANLSIENNAKVEQIPAQMPLYLCREFDPDELEAVATWRGSVDDLELLRREAAIEDMRDRLEPMADNYNALRAKFPTIVRQAQTELLAHIIETIEKESMPEGERITQIINEAVPNDLAQLVEDGKDVDPEKVEDETGEDTESVEDSPFSNEDFDLNIAVESGTTPPAEAGDD